MFDKYKKQYLYYSNEFIRHYVEHKYVILPSLNLLKKRNRHWINMSGKKLFIVTIPIHSSSFFPSTLSNQANTQPVLLLPRTTVTSMSAKSDKIIFVLFYLIFFNRTQKSFLFTWKVLVLALILVRVLWRNRTNTKLEIYIWRERTI